MLRKSISLIVLSAMVAAYCLQAARADDNPLDPEQIKAVLRAPRKEDGAFIDRTVNMVNKGTLPAELFQGTLQWARKKPTNTRFQYVKKALLMRAAGQGITIPSSASGSSSSSSQ